MKTLLLMRHAKSSWKFHELEDRFRPLTKRGRRDATLMGSMLEERDLIPQKILSSTAVRNRQTAELVAEEAEFRGEIDYLDSLYMAEAEDYIAALRELPDNIDRVMVIGHNPGLETLLQVLSGRIESLPTAVVAHINLPIDSWSGLNGEIHGEMVGIWRPKEVRELEEEEKEKEKEKEKSKKKKKK
ncbi:MAG: histidine phosphatase family protein [Chloroflexi bacterium]|nr:histidine phosphatase family protein [Chloroflexota bacterium]